MKKINNAYVCLDPISLYFSINDSIYSINRSSNYSLDVCKNTLNDFIIREAFCTIINNQMFSISQSVNIDTKELSLVRF